MPFNPLREQLAEDLRFQKVLFLALIVASFAAALYLFSTCRVVPVNADAGLYLSIARDVLNGATPTVDVSTAYTPGVFYLVAAVMRLFGDGYSTVLLFVYLVQAANTLMLYAILSRIVEKRAVAVFACLSYWYSHLLLEGWCFELEPFQVFFVLVAVILMMPAMRVSYKFPLVGLSLGCAIMCKQYSALALIAVCVVAWHDIRHSASAARSAAGVLVIAIFAAVPFLSFVMATKATFAGSLYAFGFVGSKATSYAAEGMKDHAGTIENVLLGVVRMNWLFFPVTAAWVMFLFKRRLRFSPIFSLLFGLLILPQFVRQYGHYYQLIAPWGFVMAAAVVDALISSEEKGRFLRTAIVPASLTCFVVLPLFLAFSSSFYAVPSPHALISRTTLLFLLSAAAVIAAGLYVFQMKCTGDRLALIVMALLFFETLFLSLKLPFNVYAEQKLDQQRQAAMLNKIFPRESLVYVVDYPELYFTCGYLSPIGDYGFPLTAEKLERADWTKIDRLIVSDNNRSLTHEMLLARGYRRLPLQAAPIAVYVRNEDEASRKPFPLSSPSENLRGRFH